MQNLMSAHSSSWFKCIDYNYGTARRAFVKHMSGTHQAHIKLAG